MVTQILEIKFATNFNLVPWSLFNIPVTLEFMALRIFFMYVNVFPYVTFTNFHHAALSVNKELMKGTTLTLNQLAAT